MKASTKNRAESKLREVERALKQAVVEAARNRGPGGRGFKTKVGKIKRTIGRAKRPPGNR
jgi:hypothetical protein